MIRFKWMLISSIFLITALFQTVYADPPLPTPVARVVWVKGELQATMSNQEKRNLQKTSVIYLDDTLSTDSSSQAEIVFTDDSLITFKSGTVFKVKEYQFNPKAAQSGGKYVMDLVKGGFRTITGLVAKNKPDDYAVNTPVATIGVRGTEYEAAYGNGKLYVGWIKGKPCVTNKPINKKKKAVTVCLDQKNRFAVLPNADSAAETQDARPDGLGEEVEITPAKISPFGNNGYTGGVMNSFCIS